MTSVSFPGCVDEKGGRRGQRVTRRPGSVARLTREAGRFAGRHFKASRFSERRTCAASSFRASISAVIFASSASPFFSILSSPMFAERACVASARSSDLARAQIGRTGKENPTAQNDSRVADSLPRRVAACFATTVKLTVPARRFQSDILDHSEGRGGVRGVNQPRSRRCRST